jgi:hypothetical protein
MPGTPKMIYLEFIQSDVTDYDIQNRRVDMNLHGTRKMELDAGCMTAV